jgi:hypothetical protein
MNGFKHESWENKAMEDRLQLIAFKFVLINPFLSFAEKSFPFCQIWGYNLERFWSTLNCISNGILWEVIGIENAQSWCPECRPPDTNCYPTWLRIGTQCTLVHQFNGLNSFILAVLLLMIFSLGSVSVIKHKQGKKSQQLKADQKK